MNLLPDGDLFETNPYRNLYIQISSILADVFKPLAQVPCSA